MATLDGSDASFDSSVKGLMNEPGLYQKGNQLKVEFYDTRLFFRFGLAACFLISGQR